MNTKIKIARIVLTGAAAVFLLTVIGCGSGVEGEPMTKTMGTPDKIKQGGKNDPAAFKSPE